MSDYEITIIYEIRSSQESLEEFLREVFENASYKIEKLEQTQFAYKIKGVLQGHYYVIDITTDTAHILDFQRRASFNKAILRFLVINKSTESKMFRQLSDSKMARGISRYLKKRSAEEEQNSEEGATTRSDDTNIVDAPIENVPKEARFSEVFEAMIKKRIADKEEVTIEEFFTGIGYSKDEIPEDMDTLIAEYEERERTLEQERQEALKRIHSEATESSGELE